MLQEQKLQHFVNSAPQLPAIKSSEPAGTAQQPSALLLTFRSGDRPPPPHRRSRNPDRPGVGSHEPDARLLSALWRKTKGCC
ncbi:hypothetical protein [Microcoleus vaginatus]|uniref:hypothetical protein n=1 Tax=Microcoleus vaginatus TaxID=119532 RepID=UPI00403F5483